MRIVRPARGDLVAGFTVALILIPQSLAYAELAGLPPVHGLYAAAAAPIAAAVRASPVPNILAASRETIARAAAPQTLSSNPLLLHMLLPGPLDCFQAARDRFGVDVVEQRDGMVAVLGTDGEARDLASKR